ncbi:MAG: LytTR family transcriptional regulator DNA-binding domain-containing protein [Prevotella sp.]|nr:LytTR family transcriptional regulator DNA-binding domain-containing protein [Prevotella sp.]
MRVFLLFIFSLLENASWRAVQSVVCGLPVRRLWTLSPRLANWQSVLSDSQARLTFYTEFHFANNQVKTELLTLSATEQLIGSIYENKPSPFFRMGRSYLINTSYLSNINLQRQTVKFISGESLVLPKHRVKELKESIVNGLCSDVKS